MKLKNILLASILFSPLFMGASVSRRTPDTPFPIKGETQYFDFTCSRSLKEESTDEKGNACFYYEYEINNIGEGYIFGVFASQNDNGLDQGEEKDYDSFIVSDSSQQYSCIVPGQSKTYCFYIPLKYEDNFEIHAYGHQNFAANLNVYKVDYSLSKVWEDYDGLGNNLYYYRFTYNLNYTQNKNCSYYLFTVINYNGKQYHFDDYAIIAKGELDSDKLQVTTVTVFEVQPRKSSGNNVPIDKTAVLISLLIVFVVLPAPFVALVVIIAKQNKKEKQS